MKETIPTETSLAVSAMEPWTEGPGVETDPQAKAEVGFYKILNSLAYAVNFLSQRINARQR